MAPGKKTSGTKSVQQMKSALREVAKDSDAIFLQRFFRTGPGEYGEGDRFLGVRVPATRKIVKEFATAPLSDALQLLQSEWHEERLLSLLLLVRMYQKGNAETRQSIYTAYLANARYVNNWDLVDSSAPYIVGQQLFDSASGERVLMRLARSENLWERRIAMLSTFHFIKHGEFELALGIAERLLTDSADLIQKAVGWMLREVGERDRKVLEGFLARHLHSMPRTMLRYAIEKFPEAQRQRYLKAQP